MIESNTIYNQQNIIPVWEKLNLTVKEASEYSNIGEKKVGEMIFEKVLDVITGQM